MRASFLALLSVSLLVLSACTPVPGGLGQTEECASNFPPEIGNLEVNSFQSTDETGEWAFCLHVDWIDPGRDDAGNAGSGPPNIFGGMWSMEVSGVDVISEWIDEGASPSGVTLGANSGELEQAYCSPYLVEDRVIDFEVRLRDRCNATSNEKSGTYIIGGGGAESHQVENPDVGGDGCNPVNYINAEGAFTCLRSGD
jgi:hypothetical protein